MHFSLLKKSVLNTGGGIKMALTETRVKEIIKDFISHKYPNNRLISFERVALRKDLNEFWVDAFFFLNNARMCVFCRLDAQTGNIKHYNITKY
jgi:hypothetical protein